MLTVTGEKMWTMDLLMFSLLVSHLKVRKRYPDGPYKLKVTHNTKVTQFI